MQSRASKESTRRLVDVKKVLVIGSGGLSIGQAGEFDYSGALRDETWGLQNLAKLM